MVWIFDSFESQTPGIVEVMHIWAYYGYERGKPCIISGIREELKSMWGKIYVKMSLHTEEGHVHKLIDEW